jgi:hypothetical protein
MSAAYPTYIQWNLYSSFSSGVEKETMDPGAIVEIGFAQGP